MEVKIGTRGSKLALWQANSVADMLRKGGLLPEIIIIETKGDKILNKAIAKIGSKGVFTEELETQLREKSIDIAVHSAKDLQSTLEEDFEIIAFSERENPQDVVVSFNKLARLENFDNSFIVGTSSTRRVAMMKHYFPHVRVSDVRGNLQTRMKKMERGAYDALILAYAGVARMDYEQHIVEKLPLDQFTPAVGQGAMAIEANRNLSEEKKQKIRDLVNHTATEKCLLAERAFLKTLEGGCSIPVFGLATVGATHIDLSAGIISLDGQKVLKEEMRMSKDSPEVLGNALAQKLLETGGEQILREIREHL